ncbi:MAG TPA: 2-dehydropantoate 2-reductase [Planctomycetota bacterium]|nr:2-dehydropantoate 2-reductase [Planctomycetota bacterium]
MARIAVIGGGAIGCFYAAQCVLAGHAVSVLFRRDADRVARDGLRLHRTPTDQVAGTFRGDLALSPTAMRVCRTAEELTREGAPDWILVAMKTTALGSAAPHLAEAARGGGDVVVLCNGLDVEEDLVPVIEPSRLFGMLCFVCVDRDAEGVIHHRAHGRVAVGHRDDDARRASRLADLVTGIGIRCERVASLREARWRKLAWNIPFNGLGVVGADGGANTSIILADAGLRQRAEVLMRETIAIANADLAARGRPERIDADVLVPELFERTAGMGCYRTSTQLDLLGGRPLEIEHLFARPLRRSYQLDVMAPGLARLLAELEHA